MPDGLNFAAVEMNPAPLTEAFVSLSVNSVISKAFITPLLYDTWDAGINSVLTGGSLYAIVRHIDRV